jgi:hypothetical protein
MGELPPAGISCRAGGGSFRDARALAEALAERLDLEVGTSRLELVFEDRRLVHVWRHERIWGEIA